MKIKNCRYLPKIVAYIGNVDIVVLQKENVALLFMIFYENYFYYFLT